MSGLAGKLTNLITLLSNRLKDLRGIKTAKQAALAKFKNLAGSNWKVSSLCNAISTISTHLYDVNICIRNTLNVIDNLCFVCSVLHRSSSLFCQDWKIDLKEQANYRHLKDIVGVLFHEQHYRLMKQLSPQWHEVRKDSVTTGSSLNASIGLDTLKKQQEHYDFVRFGKEREQPSAIVKEKMEYGRSNEINAAATLVGKVLPAIYPHLTFSEEGCIKVNFDEYHMIVSPDGSCFNSSSGTTEIAVEIKCPFPPNPGTYKSPVYYKIPRYYVPQILSEMRALQTEVLLFLCYSKESTVVLRGIFDSDLWQSITQELELTYGLNGERPKRRSSNYDELRNKIDQYIDEKVVFIGEFKSVVGEECAAKDGNMDEPFCVHSNSVDTVSTLKIDDVGQLLFESQNMFKNAYQLCRQRATEFLGFMVSDLDRTTSATEIYSIPVAFAMKGYSLPTHILREMIENVLMECASAGLYVPVCSFDGQWYRISVRDRNDFPLSILQLQKDVYHEIKRLPANVILSVISNKNSIKCSTFEELLQLADVKKCESRIVIRNRNDADILRVSVNIIRMITAWRCGKAKKAHNTTASAQAPPDECIASAIASLPVEVVEGIPLETLESLNDSTSNTMSRTIGNIEDIHTALCIAEESVIRMPSSNVEVIGRNNILNETDVRSMHVSLKSSTRTKTDWNMSFETFVSFFSCAENIDKHFTKNDLYDAIAPVREKLACHGVKAGASTTKRTLVTKLSGILGDGSIMPEVTRKGRKSPKSLCALSKAVVSKLPKDILSALYAENTFPEQLDNWIYHNPFGKSVNIEGLPYDGKWYSMPEYNCQTGNYLFMILDTYHQLCGLRRLVCQNGIPARGIKREAFVKIAEDSENNQCGLNQAMVNDLIDKQSAAFARATFSTKVSNALMNIGAVEEARFCILVNDWYKAEDDPGISALDRCRYRLAFRDWLLQDVRFHTFPPHGSFIRGIPIVLFEGLLTNIERKIQLFTFTKTGSYNVRAVGSLDIENFFGTFQDIDPKGTGVIRPDDIPAALSVAAELIDVKFDPNR